MITFVAAMSEEERHEEARHREVAVGKEPPQEPI
jgi:hypothetical protein